VAVRLWRTYKDNGEYYERERERERERANTVPSGAFTQRFLGMFGPAKIFAMLCYILHKFGKKSRGGNIENREQ
jgi:hypothetical protein